MIDWFYLRHRWLGTVRAPGFGFWVFVFVLIMAFAFSVSLGFAENWHSITEKINNQVHAGDKIFLLLIISFWLTDLVIKLLLPPVALVWQPYHLWNIDRRSLRIGYLVCSIFNMWTPAILLIQMTVAWKLAQSSEISLPGAIATGLFWLTTHLIPLYLQNISGRKWKFGLIAGAMLMIMMLVTWPLIIQFDHIGWLMPLLSAGVLGVFFRAWYRTVDRLEESEIRHDSHSFSKNHFMERFGSPLMQLDMTILMKTKRARSSLLLSVLMIPYLLFFYETRTEFYLFQYFILLVASGVFLFQIGTFTMAIEGNFFDLLVTRISSEQFFKHKWFFYSISGILPTLILMVLFCIKGEVWKCYVSLAFYLYNVGCNVPLVLRSALHNVEKVDLERSVFMNYQGQNSTMIVCALLCISIPMIIFGVTKSIFHSELIAGLIVGGVGFLGIIGRKLILKAIAREMDKRKYVLSESYK